MDSLSSHKPYVSPARSWGIGLVLALLTMIVFWPAVNFDFINMDDDVYVTANAHVLGGLTGENFRWAFAGLTAGFWHPLTWLSYMLDVSLWGRGASGFHFTNIFLHAVNTLLVYRLLGRLTGSVWRSAVVAALFALHPLRVEAVAWVGMRKELLGTFFGLLALLNYAAYVRKTEGGRLRVEASGLMPSSLFHVPSSSSYWLAFGCFVCGLMSKPMVVTLPVVMLLLDHWPLRRLPNFSSLISRGAPLLVEKVPFFLAGLIIGVVTVFGDFHAVSAGQGVTAVIQHSLGLRLENAVLSYVRYQGMMVWPVNLAPLYLYPAGYSFALVAGAFLLLALITVLVWGTSRSYWVVGWGWYLVTLLPVIGLIQVGPHSHADRYAYLPLIGLFTALVWGIGEWMEHRRVGRGTVIWLCVLILGALALRTRDQLRHWRDSGTLFAHTTAVTKNNYMAYALRGHYYAATGYPDGAIENFVKAIEINPDHADAWNNLGLAVAAKGRWEEAMADYRRAIEVNPGHSGAWHNFGVALAGRGRLTEALGCYRRALELNPNQAETMNNLAYLLTGQGKFAEAIPYYQAAVKLRPHEAGFRVNLAAALMSANRMKEGLAQYREALRLKPELTEVRDYLRVVDAAQGGPVPNNKGTK